MPEKANVTREMTADYQRGMAAILMVTEHLMGRNIADFGGKRLFFDLLLCALMQVFFFYAGAFAMADFQKPPKVFFRKKALRLLVPYLMWSSVAVAAKTLLTILNGTFDFAATVKLELETLYYAKSMWFFLALFLMQALFWGLHRVYTKSPLAAVLLAAVVLLLPLPEVLTLSRVREMLLAFAVGLWYGQNKQLVHEKMERAKNILWIPCVLYLAASPLYIDFITAASDEKVGAVHFICAAALSTLVAFCFWYLLDCCLKKAEKIKKALSICGVYSMQIYCIHMMFVEYLPIKPPTSIFVNGGGTQYA